MLLATHRIPGLVLRDHSFTLPLDHSAPDGEQIEVFAREAVAPRHEHANLPWLCFFQGGPGGKSPRPTGAEGWIMRAADEFRVLLLDQRGTGRSTPATRQTILKRGDAAAQADYLRHFRADAIVRDAEAIRQALAGPGSRWSILGQSYGGFCALTYLSLAPNGLREALITGGIPPVFATADEVYRHTYPLIRAKNELYFARYPADQERLHAIAAHLDTHDVRLPNGDPLTVRTLQTVGQPFGMSDGFEAVHWLLDEAFAKSADGPVLSDTFLKGVFDQTSFAVGPLYAVLHEAIYAEGTATNWAAERVRAEFPEFAYDPGRPFRFTGEMIYPWMFDDDSALRPLQPAAELLAQRADWPRLYDPEQLRRNEVPVAAAVYYNDMYVARALSEQTAAQLGSCRLWVTSEYEHNGLRADGAVIFGRLLAMARGER